MYNLVIAKGFYEFRFHTEMNGIETHYKGLLLFFHDSSSLNRMRVKFISTSGDSMLIEQRIKVEFKEGLNKNFRILKGYDVKMLQSTFDKKVIYAPDEFIFKKSATGYYEPYYSKSRLREYGTVKATIDGFKVLNNIDNNYLQFFSWGVDDIEKTENQGQSLSANKNSFSSSKKAFNVFSKLNLQNVKKLHIILVTNTKVIDIGKFCRENETKLEEYFSSMADVGGCEPNIIKINEENFTLDKLKSTLSTLNITAGIDGVIFYYSGHGFRNPDQADPFPRLELRVRTRSGHTDHTNSIGLSEVYETIKSKNPKFSFTIAECCNREIVDNAFVFDDDKDIMLAPGSLPFNKILVNHLLEFSGNVMVSTASPTQNSYYTRDGGLFRNAFTEYLDASLCVKNSEIPLSWLSLIEKSSVNTNVELKKRRPELEEVAIWTGF